MIKKSIIKTAVLCLIAGFTLSGCNKNESGDDDNGNGIVSVTGVSLNASDTVLSAGGTFALTATVAPANATNKTLTWTSSNTAVATVSNGTVTAVAVGNAVITVSTADGGKTASCAVTVNPAIVPVSGVSLSEEAKTLTVDENFTLTATVAPANATDKTLTWSSSAPAVASVVDGVVTALASGETVITVTTADGNKTASCNVQVLAVITLKVASTASSLKIGIAGTGTATIDWGDGQDNTITLNGSPTIYSYPPVHYYAGNVSRTVKVKGINMIGFDCDDARVTDLDISKNLALNTLWCQNNQLSALDLSNNTALNNLYCKNNQLSTLDLNKNTELTDLDCSYNQLSVVNVSKNTKLSWFNCYDNDLTALNFTGNTELVYLHCGANPLTAAALNSMFGTLHSNTIPGAAKEIRITYTDGVLSCNKTIAENKGWTFY